MKNLFIGLLMFAATSFAFANNGGELRKVKEVTEVVSVIETKVVNVIEDDFCSITITRTRTYTNNSGTYTTVSSSTGTGETCAQAEADARASLQ